jgi:hypothetical protein
MCQADPHVAANFSKLSFEGFRTLPGQESCSAEIDLAGTWVHGHPLPGHYDFYEVGSENRRWKRVWAERGAILTWDARLETTVEEIGQGLKEVQGQRHVTFRLKGRSQGGPVSGSWRPCVGQLSPRWLDLGPLHLRSSV